MQEMIDNLQGEIKVYEQQILEYKKSIADHNHRYNELRLQHEQLNTFYQNIKHVSEENLKSLETETNKYRRLEEEYVLAKRKLERYSGRSGASESTLETEVQILKSHLKCSVCNTRDKDTVITKCFHCFCEECVQKNISTRHRKCPRCGKPFGEGDVHKIFL